MEHVDKFKAALTAAVAGFTALWGWYGWLIAAWAASMALDYITGTCAACRAGVWSSKAARDGLWHKAGSIAAVLAAILLDLVIGQAVGNVTALPVEDWTVLGPLVVVWYILTECGSVVENAGELGAPVPKWLARRLAGLRDRMGPEDEERGDDRG